MKKPYATNKAAANRADEPIGTFEFEGRSFDLCWKGDHVLVYSDTELADRMADSFGTVAKHSPARFVNSSWSTFSIVPLPSA